MTFEDMLSRTTHRNGKAIITVGMIQGGEASYTVYGKNMAILPQERRVYMIGSITKTFTAALLFKAMEEGKIGFDDSISDFLDLPPKGYSPTIRRLVTHTAGYKGFYVERQMASNLLRGRAVEYGLSREALVRRAGKANLGNRDYPFSYSNIGFAMLGAVLSAACKTDFAALMNDYIAEELALPATVITDKWGENNAYLPSGSLTSTIEDMLTYAQLHLSGTAGYLQKTHEALARIDADSSIGAAWHLDEKHNIIWHSGSTGSYNGYLGFDPEKQLAVVILSNLPYYRHVSATAMGKTLLHDLQNQ